PPPRRERSGRRDSWARGPPRSHDTPLRPHLETRKKPPDSEGGKAPLRASPPGYGSGMTTDWTAFETRLAGKRRAIVDGFLELLRRNTVSQNPEGVRAGSEWLAALMRRRGLEARVLETGGAPAVFGERRVPGAARTVLIYCHYDTKPAPGRNWFQPSPFEPVFRQVVEADDAPFVSFDRVPTETLTDWRVYARGASDDKGPIWSHLEALALMDELDLPPKVHLKFIFDGEEEI